MPLRKEVIIADKAPKAVGPYSLGIRIGDLIFTAGQVGLLAGTGQLAGDSIEEQTHQAMANLKSVLEASGSGLDRVVKTTVFMTDLGEFQRMNAVYGEYFTQEPPARSTVQVAALPLGAKVEIECVAITRLGRGD